MVVMVGWLVVGQGYGRGHCGGRSLSLFFGGYIGFVLMCLLCLVSLTLSLSFVDLSVCFGRCLVFDLGYLYYNSIFLYLTNLGRSDHWWAHTRARRVVWYTAPQTRGLGCVACCVDLLICCRPVADRGS